jgi:hypothetical protein
MMYPANIGKKNFTACSILKSFQENIQWISPFYSDHLKEESPVTGAFFYPNPVNTVSNLL